MLSLLIQFRRGQRVWCREEAEFGTVLTAPGQVYSGRQEMVRVRMADKRELFFMPSQLEPAAVSGGYLRLATVDGRAI